MGSEGWKIGIDSFKRTHAASKTLNLHRLIFVKSLEFELSNIVLRLLTS